MVYLLLLAAIVSEVVGTSLLRATEIALGVLPAVRDSSRGADYEVGHAAQVIAVTRDGLARVQYPFGTRQRDWAHDLPRLVAYGD